MKKLPLTRERFATVDDQDFDWLNQWKWSMTGNGYAVRNARVERGLYTVVRMHRFIVDAPDGMFVDHINGDTTDNRRDNLRVCTAHQNTFNRGKQKNNKSGFKGVYLHKKKNLKKPWFARIKMRDKHHSSGGYTTSLEAAIAYNQLATQLHGEFARLNKV